ncbi:hypothetical protein FI667_g5774, partial [Globisporangium splendens]
MISSESSDEELETLHQTQVAARTAVKRTKKVKKAAPAEQTPAPQTKKRGAESDNADNTTTTTNAQEQPKVSTAVAAVASAYEVTEDMTREQKKEIRKKRKLEMRALAAKELQDIVAKQEHDERRTKGRAWTLSMAIPGSIIDNAQTKELKTYLAGQVARAAVIFQVDEIIVFDDQLGAAKNEGPQKKATDCHVFLSRILQYLETPQYLRRALFPMHSDLSCAGLLNPLDCPHHLRSNEWSVYREGVVVDRPLKDKEGSHVHVGLQREVVVDKRIQTGIRVTVKIDAATKDHKKKMMGKLVSSAEPREQLGVYWGYTSRFASSLSNVWQDSPFKGGYDLKIGTSERGHVSVDDAGFKLPAFRHALVVFGGVAGIEECVNADETIPVSGEDSHSLFDMWVNTCPAQGSRTIRSEEAVLISLASLRQHLTLSGKHA